MFYSCSHIFNLNSSLQMNSIVLYYNDMLHTCCMFQFLHWARRHWHELPFIQRQAEFTSSLHQHWNRAKLLQLKRSFTRSSHLFKQSEGSCLYTEWAIKYLTPSIRGAHFHLTRWIWITWSCCQNTIHPFAKGKHHYPPLIILCHIRVSLSVTPNPSLLAVFVGFTGAAEEEWCRNVVGGQVPGAETIII